MKVREGAVTFFPPTTAVEVLEGVVMVFLPIAIVFPLTTAGVTEENPLLVRPAGLGLVLVGGFAVEASFGLFADFVIDGISFELFTLESGNGCLAFLRLPDALGSLGRGLGWASDFDCFTPWLPVFSADRPFLSDWCRARPEN